MKDIIFDTGSVLDLHLADLKPFILQMPWKKHTTQYVVEELDAPCQQSIKEWETNDIMLVEYYSDDKYNILWELYMRLSQRDGISFADFSVLNMAQEKDYTLVTDDDKLRKVAQKLKCKVIGMLDVLDIMVRQGLIELDLAIRALQHLHENNKRAFKHCWGIVETWQKEVWKHTVPLTITVSLIEITPEGEARAKV